MISNGKKIADKTALKYDICIVGSGPAGITLTAQLKDTKQRICLLEAGGTRPTETVQKKFYGGENIGLDYDVDISRTRCFGGTSHQWQGYCSPLDPLDFEENPWIPKSGWPIAYNDFYPYYPKAHAFMGLPIFEYDVEKWTNETFIPARFANHEMTNKLWHYKQVRFHRKFGKSLKNAKNIDVYTNSAMTKLHLRPASDSVSHVVVNTAPDKTFTVRAKTYVLACGGLENARILLAQRQRDPQVCQNDNIGRYFMEHPHYRRCANLLLFGEFADSKLYTRNSVETGRGSANICAYLQIGEAIRKQKRYPNAVFRLDKPADQPALKESIIQFMHRLYPNRPLQDRVARLVMMVEQAPNPDSRVLLADRRDPYGMPHLRLDWRLTDAEIRATVKFTRFLGLKLGQNAVGRLQIEKWVNNRRLRGNAGYGEHHMGTTRMAKTPTDGVVDTNCKMFGLDNFFLAGSSVFPTVGCANPTLTIVAMSIRLADHLKSRF